MRFKSKKKNKPQDFYPSLTLRAMPSFEIATYLICLSVCIFEERWGGSIIEQGHSCLELGKCLIKFHSYHSLAVV